MNKLQRAIAEFRFCFHMWKVLLDPTGAIARDSKGNGLTRPISAYYACVPQHFFDYLTERQFFSEEELKLEAALCYIRDLIHVDCVQPDDSLTHKGNMIYWEAFDFLVEEGLLVQSDEINELGRSKYYWVPEK